MLDRQRRSASMKCYAFPWTRNVQCGIKVREIRTNFQQVETKVPRNDKMTYYDEISEGYEELHKEEQLKKVELISKYLKVKPDDLLLDVGCGTGLTTKPWKCKTVGADPAIKLLEKAGKGIWVNAEAEHLPFKDNTFDWVISVTAIQNFNDIEKGLKEIKRVGKGKYVLTFLKKSNKNIYILELLHSLYKVKNIVEEDKDLVFVIE